MKRLIPIAALVTLASFSAPTVSAQPVAYLNVTTLEIESGQRGVFEEYERRISEARARVGERNSAGVHRTRAGGPLNVYRVVRGFDTVEEMESWLPIGELLRTAFGEREGARILEEGAASIRSISTEIHSYSPELSSPSSCGEGGNFIHVVTTQIDPALYPDHVAMLESLKRAEESAGFCRTRRSVRVGPLFTISAIHSADSMAELLAAPGPVQLLQEAYGEEVARAMWDRANAAVRSRTIELVERIDELSYDVE